MGLILRKKQGKKSGKMKRKTQCEKTLENISHTRSGWTEIQVISSVDAEHIANRK
jgi:hypothetical protein